MDRLAADDLILIDVHFIAALQSLHIILDVSGAHSRESPID